MAAAAPELRAGSRLGRYELVREIGRGGFAAVWLARLPGPGGFEQRVAIKMIRTDIGTDPSFRNMFLDEARLAAHISHPNVASIFELGQEGELLYMVMEHVVGRPLHVLRNIAERRGRKIPVEIVLRILSDTCAGLHAAHEVKRDGKHLEVIHRDVSPQNILVSDKGMSKLIDFGVAKANDRLAGDTSTGLAKGKVRYMAPEQATMKDPDRRADIWSVGAVAYDLIEGHPPFDGPNDLARMYGLLGDDPVPAFTAHVPAPIERVIFKALARDPERRWPTAAALRNAFEQAMDECGFRVTPDTVVEWFGDSLLPEGDGTQSPNESSMLRERLRRPSTGASGMPTLDVPIMDGGPPPAPHEPLAPHPHPLQERVETLAAVSSAGIIMPPARPKRLWLPLAAAAAVVTFIGLGVVWRAGQASVTVATDTPTPTPTPTPIQTPTPTPIPTPIPTPTPTPTPIELDDPPPPPSAAVRPAPTPRPKVTPKPTPKPKPKPTSSPAPTPRPKYDDTIQ